MKNITTFLILLLLTSSAFAQEKQLVLGEQPVFKVSKANQTITIDGKMDEAVWAETEARTFDYFYRLEQSDDKQKTTFRMLWDDQNLYAFFECEDKFITAREKNRDGQPYFDDCAELFLIPVPDSLSMHIGFELNLYKACNDFVFFNDFYDGQNVAMKSYNPNFEVEVTVDGTINNNSDIDRGWTMELAIPLKEFTQIDEWFPVKEGNRWAFLAIRQERNDAEGNRRSTSTIFPLYDMSKGGVHQPNRFGLMEFVK